VKKYKLLTAAIVFLMPSVILGQAALLENGASGGGFIGGVEVNTQGIAAQGGIIGTISGRFDIGALVAKELFVKYGSPAATSLHFELFGLREGQPKGCPLSLSGFYQITNISFLDFRTYGFSVYKRLGEKRGSFFQPTVSAFQIKENRNYRNDVKGILLGFSVAAGMSDEAIFHMTPSMTIIKDVNTFTIVMGISFSDTPVE